MIALGEKMGLIHKSGTSYSYLPEGKGSEEVKLGRGYDATRTFLKENLKIKEEILKKIRQMLKEGKALEMKAPVESTEGSEE